MDDLRVRGIGKSVIEVDEEVPQAEGEPKIETVCTCVTYLQFRGLWKGHHQNVHQILAKLIVCSPFKN